MWEVEKFQMEENKITNFENFTKTYALCRGFVGFVKEKYPLIYKEYCERCSSTDRLHFHHTNYELNKGITLCKKCHITEHGEKNHD